jgi:hypothetical protein
MRRNEKIYKTPLGNIDQRKLWTRIYRKYTGGDEFIFLIRGPEEEALGFLVRIHRMTIGHIKSEISAILGTTVDFDFHGAICPIFPKDNASTAIARLRDCYNVVKKRGVSREPLAKFIERGEFPCVRGAERPALRPARA